MIEFNELIKIGTGKIKIVSNSSEREIWVNDTRKVTIDGKILTINLAQDLEYDTEYHVLIDSTAITDLAGNNYKGINDNASWRFKTVAKQSTTTPPSGSTSIPISTILSPSNTSVTTSKTAPSTSVTKASSTTNDDGRPIVQTERIPVPGVPEKDWPTTTPFTSLTIYVETFIPEDKVVPKVDVPIPLTGGNTINLLEPYRFLFYEYFKGDGKDRSFHPQKEKTRIWSEVLVQVDPNKNDITHSSKHGANESVGVRKNGDEDRKTADLKGMKENVKGVKDRFTVEIKGEANDPLTFGKCIDLGVDLDYEYKLEFSRTDNQSSNPWSWKLSGTHDGYPAHAVYINQNLIYAHDPRKNGEDIFDLLPEVDVTIPFKGGNTILRSQKSVSKSGHIDINGNLIDSKVFNFNFGQSTIEKVHKIDRFTIGADKIRVNANFLAPVGVGIVPINANLLAPVGVGIVPISLTRAANSEATTLKNMVDDVFKNAGSVRIQKLGANSAALVVNVNKSTDIAGTYLVINDSHIEFNPDKDLLINITGYTGTLPGFGTINNVQDFFV